MALNWVRRFTFQLNFHLVGLLHIQFIVHNVCLCELKKTKQLQQNFHCITLHCISLTGPSGRNRSSSRDICEFVYVFFPSSCIFKVTNFQNCLGVKYDQFLKQDQETWLCRTQIPIPLSHINFYKNVVSFPLISIHFQ